MKLEQLATFVAGLRGLWLAIGEFNLPPRVLEAAGVATKLKACITAPSNVEYTSMAGRCQMFDYALHSLGLWPWIEPMQADLTRNRTSSRTKQAHYGVVVKLLGSIEFALTRELVLPAPFVHPPLPPTAPDPSSKR